MLYPEFNELLALGHKAAHLNVNSHRAVASVIAGDSASPFRGQGLEFEEVREYVAGDDVRNIDWRVTARTGKPHLKIFTEEKERCVILCVDRNNTMRFGTRGTFKSIQAARCAALLGWKANRQNDRMGASVFGNVEGGMQFFSPKRSRRSLWNMMQLLCDKQEDIHPDYVLLEDTLKHLNRAAPTGALIYIISDFLVISDHLERQLRNLQQRCDVVILPVNDPADQTIVPIGTVTFASDGTNELLVNTDSKTARNAYNEQWQQNRKHLLDMCNHHRIGMIPLATNSDLFRSLSLGLKHLGKRR